MKDYYLRTMTVRIPLEDGPVVIRQGKTVEYQLERTYESEDKSTRVKRRVIGKVDPVNPGRMFPNETYFLLFPENEVPEEVRDEFLRGCEIKRRMQEIRRSPEEIVDRVINGLNELRDDGRNVGDGSVVPHSWNEQNRPWPFPGACAACFEARGLRSPYPLEQQHRMR